MLKTLERRRNELSAKIKGIAERFEANGKKWKTDAERQEWEECNREFDEVSAEIDTRFGIPGLEDSHTLRNRNQADETDLAIALASWMRNAAGYPVSGEDFQRSLAIGRDPRAAVFDIPFRTGSPTRGLQVRAQGTQGAGSGGNLVPTGFMDRLESQMKAFGPMLQTSEVWTTEDGRPTPWPTIDDTGNTGSQVGENADVGDATDMVFGSVLFQSFKQTTGVLKASHELLRDSAIDLANVVADKLGERLGRTVNTKTTTGVGANGTPSGIVIGAPVGKTAASATAITMDELIDLLHAVDPAYRNLPGTGWMMNDSTAAYIAKLKDGNGDYLWRQSTVAGEPSTLLGYPVNINQDMADIATGVKPVLFGDLSKHKLRIVRGVRMRTLMERYAEYDQVGFIGFIEIDSCLMKPSTTDSLSPVQALQMA